MTPNFQFSALILVVGKQRSIQTNNLTCP